MTLSSESRCQPSRVGTASCFVSLVFAGLAQATEPPKPQPVVAGAAVTVKDAAGRPWCATVVSVGRGVDAESWAWLHYNAEPRRIDHAPLRELVPGCAVQPARQEPARRVVEPQPAALPPTGAVR